jgi:hypothetical protein
MLTMTTEQQDAFFGALLTHRYLAPTAWRLQFFREWARWENCGARWNPLATTWESTDVSTIDNWNSAGVRQYATEADGLAATAHTLALGYYFDIADALDSQSLRNADAVHDNLTVWGTTGFANAIAAGWAPDASTEAPPPDPVDDAGPAPDDPPTQPTSVQDQVTATWQRVLALTEAFERNDELLRWHQATLAFIAAGHVAAAQGVVELGLQLEAAMHSAQEQLSGHAD